MVIGFVVDGVAGLMVCGGTVARGLFGIKRFSGTKPENRCPLFRLKRFLGTKLNSIPGMNPAIWLRNSEKGRKFTWLKESKILCQING